MRRIIHGVGAILVLVLVLIGLPVLLVAVWPVGLPHVQLTPAGVWAALLRPDDGTLLLTVIKVAGWITWLILLIAILIEAVGRLRHIRPRRLPGLALPQGIARGLIAASLALFLNTNTTIGQPAVTAALAAPLTPAPAAAPHQPAERHAEKQTAQYERYTVKKGDTLSEIAMEHLGNGHRYPEIFKASRHIHQPKGYRLTVPDVIDIGWKLNIPTDETQVHRPTKKDQEQRRSQPADVTPSTRPSPSPTAPPATVNPTQDTEPNGDATASPADADTDATASVPAWLLTGLAGAGAILAAALWIVLLRRRAVQHHHRLPGYVTAPAPAATIPVEKTLRYQGRPVSDLLTAIDDNLRRLAATLTAANQELPALVAVAAKPGQLELHLATVATLPEPWQSEDDHTVWRLTLADLPDDLDPLEPDGPAPWPHLATIGADARGWWLINLEAAGITAIDGDPDYAADLARYLAAELATSPWSRDIQVDLIDVFEELAELDPQRLRHHPDPSAIDEVIGFGVDTIDRLNHLQLHDLPAARAIQAGDEIWLNRVLVTQQATGNLGSLQQLLNDHPGRTAIATLIVGAGQAPTPSLDITVEADGRVHIPHSGST